MLFSFWFDGVTGSAGGPKSIQSGDRVSNFANWSLKQFEAKGIEPMEIGNLLTKIEEGSSSMLAVLSTI